MDLKQRLLIYIQRLGVSVAEFERNAGLSILKVPPASRLATPVTVTLFSTKLFYLLRR